MAEHTVDSSDYRTSHLNRGGTYDVYLAETPFDLYMDRWESHHLVQLVRGLFPAGVPRCLDFACGTGRITKLLEPLSRECYGVDISESMLEVARRKCPATKFVCADLTAQPSELEPFDLVTSFRFFGNAQDELRGQALRALSGGLRDGGYLIINNHRNPHSVMAVLRRFADGTSDEMDLSYFKLRRLLREHGFAINRKLPIGFWIFRGRLAGRLSRLDAGQYLERLFGRAWVVPFAPDAILVARKVGPSEAVRPEPSDE